MVNLLGNQVLLVESQVDSPLASRLEYQVAARFLHQLANLLINLVDSLAVNQQIAPVGSQVVSQVDCLLWIQVGAQLDYRQGNQLLIPQMYHPVSRLVVQVILLENQVGSLVDNHLESRLEYLRENQVDNHRENHLMLPVVFPLDNPQVILLVNRQRSQVGNLLGNQAGIPALSLLINLREVPLDSLLKFPQENQLAILVIVPLVCLRPYLLKSLVVNPVANPPPNHLVNHLPNRQVNQV